MIFFLSICAEELDVVTSPISVSHEVCPYLDKLPHCIEDNGALLLTCREELMEQNLQLRLVSQSLKCY